MIDENKLKKYIMTEINPYGKPFEGTVYEFGNMLMDYIERMEKEPERKWIPVTYHKPVEEDGEDAQYEYILDCNLPDEGQEILVSSHGRVSIDECCYDDGWYLDSYGDWMVVDAWQPLPEPWEGE